MAGRRDDGETGDEVGWVMCRIYRKAAQSYQHKYLGMCLHQVFRYNSTQCPEISDLMSSLLVLTARNYVTT